MAIFTGTGGDDAIKGSTAVDTMLGLGGDDALFGLGGNDTIDGGAGRDTMVGGTGDDTYIADSRFDAVVEAAGEGRDTLLSSANVFLATSPAEIEVVQITGTAGRQVVGNATRDQTLIGSSGNDDLRSGGVDATLIGGAGNDLYFVDGDDALLENAGAGIDSVFFNQGGAGGNAFTLAANLENLSANNVSSAARAILTGNGLDNSITGLNAADTLFGLNGADVLVGGAGNDVLDGGSNLDTLVGGTGDDTFVVADTTNFQIDRISEAAGEGRDTILASRNVNLATLGNASGLPLEIEVIQVTRTTTTQVIGNGTADQTLIGNVGDDDLRSGGGGDSTLVGGAGNDTYFAVGGDVLVESAGQGVDSVFFNQATNGNAFTLAAEFENLSANNASPAASAVLTGNAADNTIAGLNADDTLFGLGGADVLNGGAGDDTLLGGAGADTMEGSTGNDFFSVDNAADLAVELAGQGTDRIDSTVSYALGAGQSIETLQLLGTDNINATGNELANTLIGNSGHNAFSGGAGTDELTGLSGNDAFVYALGNGVDRISDFTNAGLALGDFIVLDDTGITSFAQLLPLITDVGGSCQIQFNANDFLVLAGVSKAQLDASDFVFD